MKRFCLAEYCAADFYMGWWLYERETNDGHRNSDGEWGWLRADTQRQRLHDLCGRMGCEPPAVTRHGQAFAEWFAETFPHGLWVRVNEDTQPHYELIDIVSKRPRQRRGVVRTIRGAASADRARSRAT